MEVANTTNALLNGNIVNLLAVLAFVIVVLAVIMVLARRGVLSVRGTKITLGNDELERKIIRQQMEYAKAELDSYFAEMIRQNQHAEHFDEMKCLYSKELTYDVFIEAVYLNHMTTDEFYIESKLIKIWAHLSKLKLSSQFCTEEFRDNCKAEVTKIIKKMYDIRKYYSKPQLYT